MIRIRRWAFISENVLKMVTAKRPNIFPFCIADAIPLANGEPPIAADRLPWPGVGLLEPRDHARRFRFELAEVWASRLVVDVVVRQRTVEWILRGDEGNWNIIPARAGIRIVISAVVGSPICIPRS